MQDEDVAAAFEILVEAIEAQIDRVNDQGSQALKKSDYERARQALEQGARLSAYRTRVRQVAGEWGQVRMTESRVVPARRPPPQAIRRQTASRLTAGLRTPVGDFRVPLLEALRGMGGRGEVDAVLDQIEVIMRDRLNEYDLQPLQATGVIRWRNTAQWCRNDLADEGLISRDSRRGTWELSDRGRAEADRLSDEAVHGTPTT